MGKRKENKIIRQTNEIIIFEIISKYGTFHIEVDKQDWEKVNNYYWSISQSSPGYFRAETRNENRKLLRLHVFLNKSIKIEHFVSGVLQQNSLNSKKSIVSKPRRKGNNIIFQDSETTIFQIESNKYGTKEVCVDTEDWNNVNQYTWFLNKANKKNGEEYYRVETHKVTNKIKERIRLHRLILNFPLQAIDHIDRNPLNNKKNNLQIVTKSDNMRNQRKIRNKTGCLGIKMEGKKFIATITVGYKPVYIGSFNTLDEASQARDLKALSLYKNARLNFPELKEEYLKQLKERS